MEIQVPSPTSEVPPRPRWPSRRERWQISRREFRSALGTEGLKALLVFLACGLVTTIGAWITIRTWGSTNTLEVVLPLGSEWDAARVNLPMFWFLYALAVALTGWLLSGQVSKSWLRLFVGVSVVIGALLLVSIGRNARVDQATAAAKVEARQLLAAETSETEQATVQTSLLAELCARGDVSPCTNSVGIEMLRLDDDQRPVELQCLTGWTLSAFEEWLNEASVERRVAALSALTRCELGAFGPVSESTDSEGTDGPTAALEAIDEAMGVQRSEVHVFEAIATGADGVLSYASGSTDFPEFRFSDAAWIALLALSLLWYRRLEIRAGDRRLGPVDIQFETDPGGDTSDKDPGKDRGKDRGENDDSESFDAVTRYAGQAVFKEAVLRNVPEPGAVPGAQALAPVGDLVARTETPHKWLIGGVIDAAQTIFATRSGFTVLYTAHQSDDESAASHGARTSVVFVRIRDTRTGNQLASMTFTEDRLEAAAQLAGYWVAGWIIHRSRYVPKWAEWSESDARAFYSLQWAQGDDLPLRLRGMVDPSTIDPNTVNSLILAQRAYAYQIGLDDTGPYLFNALEDFSKAVHRRNRYPVARYRRGAALSALMQDGVNVADVFLPLPGEQPTPSASRLRYLFGDLIGDHGTCSESCIKSIQEDGRFPKPMREEMLQRVGQWSIANRAEARWGWLARLRPSERGFWSEFERGGLKDDWTMLLDTTFLICAERLRQVAGPEGSEQLSPNRRTRHDIEERAKAPDSHWQISYNLACLFSLRSLRHAAEDSETCDAACKARRAAFDWLERCIDRPYSAQLVREWASKDPDLRPLHGIADFHRWLQRVPPMPLVLRLGDRNSRVKDLQRELNELGVSPSLTEDGEFGDRTQQTVRDFQRQNGLRDDGAVGPRTQASLEAQRSRAATADRGREIAATHW